MAGEIQEIVSKVLRSSDVIFSEFKAGYDPRFRLYCDLQDYDPLVVRRDCCVNQNIKSWQL